MAVECSSNDEILLDQIQKIRKQISGAIKKAERMMNDPSRTKEACDKLTAEITWLKFLESIHIETRRIYPEVGSVSVRFYDSTWEIMIRGRK